MIIKTCDRCGKEISVINNLMPVLMSTKNKLMITKMDEVVDSETTTPNIKVVDLCEECDTYIYNEIFGKEIEEKGDIR